MFQASDYDRPLQQLEAFFGASHADQPVTHHLGPDELRDRLSLELPLDGKPLAEREARYSFDKAVHLLGIGTANVWSVAVDGMGKMVVSELDLITKWCFG